MQDGAVIDKNLAWALYGSEKVSGMNIYINGVKFYIAGVIDLPETEAEKKTAGSSPKAYISYDMASQVSTDSKFSPTSPMELLTAVLRGLPVMNVLSLTRLKASLIRPLNPF